jgi:hypothetical protein
MASRRLPDSPQSADPAASVEARTLRRPANPPSPPGPPKTPLNVPARARVTPEARRALIAENAYLRAERRGFDPGHETEDWLAAEAEVDALLRAGQGSQQ